ncbi:hypothetical protein F0U44_03515 [Nocardioides humilatus]|uniref:Uncharacterized protein n=1 Tax=Nocardioides humilatus TaxID=2607660 RepID=A0A5B1LKX4_9ACTN|nr:hypothetical protein [Nocardioides humilatus]KAA1421381.1 hypothetical protein F0U44_03515 [Nocardioides humilatus]
MDDRVIFEARASVLADLEARGVATAGTVSVLDEACSQRRWWIEQWPEGADFVAGLIAQDVQDALVDEHGRTGPTGLWPLCQRCDDVPLHALHIEPDLGGPDPTWVCDESGTEVAALGRLGSQIS